MKWFCFHESPKDVLLLQREENSTGKKIFKQLETIFLPCHTLHSESAVCEKHMAFVQAM
jgi:hypothetical protein